MRNNVSALSRAVAGPRNKVLNAKNYISPEGVLYLYGVIGDWWDGLDALSIVRMIEEMAGDEITVRFQTPGGNLVEGLAMYNALKQSPKRVIGYIDGVAASMGAAIAMACDVLYIPNLDGIGGNANTLREVADNLDSLEAAYVQLHADKTGKGPEEIAALISDGKDHFFRGQEAIDYGLADELVEPIKVAAQAKFDDLTIPVRYARQLFSTNAAAAAQPPSKEKLMKFRIKRKNGGTAQVAALLTALAALGTLDDVVAKLDELRLSADVSEIVTGKAEATDDDIASLAEALGVKDGGKSPSTPAKDGQASAGSNSGQQASGNADALAAAAEAAAEKAVREDRARQRELRAIGAQASVDEKVIQEWIDKEITVADARGQALEAVAKRDREGFPTSGHVRTHNSNPQGLRSAMANAILVRGVPSVYKLEDAAAQFRGMSLMDMAKAYLEMNGETVRGKNRNDIVAMAMMTTSDFPNIVADVANKELLRMYQLAPRTFTAIARQTSAIDFKNKNVLQIGTGSKLEKTNQNGEFRHGKFSEKAESYKLETFGRVFSFSRQLMINDDLDALIRFMQLMGSAASRLESDTVWALVTSNPNLSDNVAVYSTAATRKNQISGAAIDETTLDGLRKKIRQQKDLDGAELNISPKFLCVGSERETAAQKFLATNLQPNQASQVNPFSGSMELIVETRLDDGANNPFYAFIDPAMGPTLAYCYLEGEEQPYMETQVGFEVDGMKMKIRHDFGAGWEDFRGTAKCTGA